MECDEIVIAPNARKLLTVILGYYIITLLKKNYEKNICGGRLCRGIFGSK